MRDIISIDFGNGDAAYAYARQLTAPYEPTGDQIRRAAEILQRSVARYSEPEIAPHDHRIRQAAEEAGFAEGTVEFERMVDALCIIWQVPARQLPLQTVEGTVTVHSHLEAVNGLVSTTSDHTTAQCMVRLRHSERAVVHDGTETLVRSFIIAGTEPDKISVVARERGSTQDTERIKIVYIEGNGLRTALRFAYKSGLLDKLVWWLVGVAAVGFVASLVLHLVTAYGVDSATVVSHLTWMDGWVSRLSSSAVFAVLTAIGVSLLGLRGSQYRLDGRYLMIRWEAIPINRP